MNNSHKAILIILVILMSSFGIAQDLFGVELGEDKSEFCKIYTTTDCTEQRESAMIDVDGMAVFYVYEADASDKIIELSTILPEYVITARDARTKRKMNRDFSDWIESTNKFFDQQPKANFDVKGGSGEDHDLYIWENDTYQASLLLLVDANDSNLYFPAYRIIKKFDNEKMIEQLAETIVNGTILFTVECDGITTSLNDFYACFQYEEEAELEHEEIIQSISSAFANFDEQSNFDISFPEQWEQPFTNRAQYRLFLTYGKRVYRVFFAHDTRYLLIRSESE